MAWKPASDESLQMEISNPFWQAISSCYDNACPLEALPRWDWDILKREYITLRKNEQHVDLRAMRSKLPRNLLQLPLGPKDIDLIDFLLNYEFDRILNIQGPRGAGKTSFLHYVESVLINSQLKNYPIFIIINCLEEKSRKQTEEDYCKLIFDSIVETISNIDDLLIKKVLQQVANKANSRLTFACLREAFNRAKYELPREQFNRIFLIFDNLDQNDIQSVGLGIEIAKQIYISSKIGIMACLRPGCQAALFKRGDARAFFSLTLKLNAPCTREWIYKLENRLQFAAQHLIKKNKTRLRAYNKKISAEKIGVAISRFAQILHDPDRRRGDDAIKILDAVSADDTRHLAILVRRILSNRDLPGQWLLGFEDERPAFHPLPALFKGRKFFFEHNRWIPNILFFESPDGEFDFLVCHRILRLLNCRIHPFPTNVLINCLKIIGYSRSFVSYCLKMLHESLLIRSTDAEIIDPAEGLPEAFFLTQSGRYYLNHLLTFTDYFATVVLDIPLRHQRVSETISKPTPYIGFAGRIYSMIEYIKEIVLKENAQIGKLNNDSDCPEKFLVLDSLRNGGLLVHALYSTIKDATERGMYSKSITVYEAIKHLDNYSKALNIKIEDLEQKLSEIYYRAYEEKEIPESKSWKTLSGNYLEINFSHFANELHLHTKITINDQLQQCSVALVGLNCFSRDKKQLITLSGVAIPTQENNQNLYAQIERSNETVDFCLNEIEPSPILHISEPSIGIGILTTDHVSPDHICIKFFELQGNDKPRPWNIGKQVSIKHLKQISDDAISRVSREYLDHARLREALYVRGSIIARNVLSPEGHNILASFYKSIHTVILFSQDKDVIIPWEWLRPISEIGGEKVGLISESWRIIRWPIKVMGDIITSSFSLNDYSNLIDPLCTIGLPVDKNTPWRHETPSNVFELENKAKYSNTVHIVGHYKTETHTIEIPGGLSLSTDDIMAIDMCGPKNYIISACSPASVAPDQSIPITLAKQCKCAVWSPITEICDTAVEAFDVSLAEYAENNKSHGIDVFFKKEKSKNQFVNLYICYAAI